MTQDIGVDTTWIGSHTADKHVMTNWGCLVFYNMLA